MTARTGCPQFGGAAPWLQGLGPIFSQVSLFSRAVFGGPATRWVAGGRRPLTVPSAPLTPCARRPKKFAGPPAALPRGEPSLPGIRRRSSIRPRSTDFHEACAQPRSNHDVVRFTAIRCFQAGDGSSIQVDLREASRAVKHSAMRNTAWVPSSISHGCPLEIADVACPQASWTLLAASRTRFPEDTPSDGSSQPAINAASQEALLRDQAGRGDFEQFWAAGWGRESRWLETPSRPRWEHVDSFVRRGSAQRRQIA